MHGVDLVESFSSNQIIIPSNIWLEKSVSIQPLTNSVKFARSPYTDPPDVTMETFERMSK